MPHLTNLEASFFNVSRSGCYRFISASLCKRKQENFRLLEEIKIIHKARRELYGSPRIHAQLRIQGESYSRKRIARIMNTEGLQAKMKRRFKVTTQVDLLAKKAPNLLQQRFIAQEPNQRWIADIT
jgi:putative transposase